MNTRALTLDIFRTAKVGCPDNIDAIRLLVQGVLGNVVAGYLFSTVFRCVPLESTKKRQAYPS